MEARHHQVPTDEKALLEELSSAFRAHFGEKAARLFFAPSRINIIGEHIDYNGGNVFPCALTIGTYALAAPNEENALRLYSLNLDAENTATLPLNEEKAPDDWTGYVLGVFHALEQKGLKPVGLDIAVAGNIPNGSGLSSSASLELLCGVIAEALFEKTTDETLTRLDLVEAGVWCENEYLGVHTGIMDQYVIGFGKAGHAMRLDTAAKQHEYVPLELEAKGACILVLNTNKRRELKDSKYNERRAECATALKELNRLLREKGEAPREFLCDFSEDELNWLDGLDPVIAKRARHVITENARVQAMIDAFADSRLEDAGQILNDGHRSLRDDYEVTGPHLDAIVEAAQSAEGCYGARMTGAGFGGCAIALVRQDAVDAVIAHIKKIYAEKTDRTAECLISLAGDGAGERVVAAN
ncbi:MAG: galactokinase [Peptoniphilaceae bacterium]|nr:galactokinase [Peptoniphilaceae bacterium]MDY6085264.1 galactokinase [Peptoniphilaceae bacterium]